MKKVFIFIVVVLFIYGTNAHAQLPSVERYVVASSGGTWTNGTSLEVDYTIGDIAVTTLNNSNNFLTQGFQQPLEGGVFINEDENGVMITTYPNPVRTILTIRIFNSTEPGFDAELFDLFGQQVAKYSVLCDNSGTSAFTFDMQGLAAGTFFLHLTVGNNFVKNIKVLKITN